MNIKETLRGIQALLHKVKNSQWRVINTTGKILPGSLDPVSQDVTFTNTYKAKISEIGQTLTTLPCYSQPKTKKKSIEWLTKSVNVRMFHNRQLLNAMSTPSLISGDVSIAAVDSFGNAIDARILGGGLKPEYLEAIKGTTFMVNSYTDVGHHNGLPVTASAAFIVELPKTILESFTQDQVMSLVKKYCALGSIPVILYY